MPEYKSVNGEWFLVVNGKVTERTNTGLSDDDIERIQKAANAPAPAFIRPEGATESEQKQIDNLPQTEEVKRLKRGRRTV